MGKLRDWQGVFGPLGALFRIDWRSAGRTTQSVLAAHGASTIPAHLPKGLVTTAGPGARLDWLVSRPLRSALGGRIVELYFRQLFEKSAPLYVDFSFRRFRFDATKDLLRWTPLSRVVIQPSTREAVTILYDGLFSNDDTLMARGVVALGLARSESPEDSAAAVAALHGHLSGISLRAVDFRTVSLSSTSWRMASAAAHHGTRLSGDLIAVGVLLGTMTRTLRLLRATVDVGGAYMRAKNS